MERRKKQLYEKRAHAQAEQRYKELDARQQQKALVDHLQQPPPRKIVKLLQIIV